MKNVLLAIFWILSIASLTSGCTAEKYFATPGNFTKQSGWVYLKTGEKIKGDISVNNLQGNTISIVTESGATRTCNLADVSACITDAGVFEPVFIKADGVVTASTPVLMQRLTPDSFTIHLYEAYEPQYNSKVASDITLGHGIGYNLEYYLHLAGDAPSEVWKLSSGVLPKHLSNGLENALNTCPDLVSKVQISDPAYNIYFTPQFNLGDVRIGMSAQSKKEKAQIVLRVLNEYEQCRKFTHSLNHVMP